MQPCVLRLPSYLIPFSFCCWLGCFPIQAQGAPILNDVGQKDLDPNFVECRKVQLKIRGSFIFNHKSMEPDV